MDHDDRVLDGLNAKKIICSRCECVVIQPNKATFIEKEILLPATADEDGELVTQFWNLKDMFDFDNVAFTHSLKEVKFLTCAECERGILGVQLLSDPNNFYVAIDRVSYS